MTGGNGTCQAAPDRNGKRPARQPAALAATWENGLGCGNRFRVLYDIDPERRVVQILAIGEKDGNRLFIGEEEVGP